MLQELTAISPIDGRYHEKTKDLSNYFSEYALIKYRITIEVEYFIALCELPLPQLIRFPKDDIKKLRDIIKDFDVEEGHKVKDIEKETNHDVKAVEYYFKNKLEELNLGQFKEFVHFGLTSQDINNTAMPMALKRFIEGSYLSFFEKEFLNELNTLAFEWKQIPMLARTHGQPASPTTVGRELMVFIERIDQQMKVLKSIPHTCKFGGATGSLNAHYATYGAINWLSFAEDFCSKKLGLERQLLTTQIEHYDYMASFFDAFRRVNNILLDLSRDIWSYISFDYFGQRLRKSEVGSSTMPHKVNPIDFENAEGNLMTANTLFDFLANKLPVSRLQRDLTDSTVARNIGVPMAHTMIALKSLKKGLSKLTLNESKIKQDLSDNYAVVTEAIQTILRREGFQNPYEQLKTFSRGKGKLGKKDIANFVDKLEIAADVKEEILEITPENYLGYTNQISREKEKKKSAN